MLHGILVANAAAAVAGFAMMPPLLFRAEQSSSGSTIAEWSSSSSRFVSYRLLLSPQHLFLDRWPLKFKTLFSMENLEDYSKQQK